MNSLRRVSRAEQNERIALMGPHGQHFHRELQRGWRASAPMWERAHTDGLSGGIIGGMIRHLGLYADEHLEKHGTKIGDDSVLGPHWRDAVHALMGLLNGELNGLDGGLTDRHLRNMLKLEGFDE